MPKQLHKDDFTDAGAKRESLISKDLLIEAVTGISLYAHFARQFTMTDRDIDMFVVESLVALGENSPLAAIDMVPYLSRAEEVFERGKNLYLWSCEAFGKTPEKIRATMIATVERDEAGPFEIGGNENRRRARRDGQQDVAYWERVCIEKLSSLSGVALKSMAFERVDIDVFGFLHKTLATISRGLSVFELVALAQLVEKEKLKLVAAILAGDTIVEAPSPHAAVRRAEIFVISETPPPASSGSCRTGFTG